MKMMWSACYKPQRHRGVLVSVGCLLAGGISGAAQAAETLPTPSMSRTQLVVKLATDERIPVQSHFESDPPTIRLEFPPARVIGRLPERSVISRGAIHEIRATYEVESAGTEPRQWLRSLSIRLRDAYEHTVRVERGQVRIEVIHPALMASEMLEVGLSGGLVVSSRPFGRVSDRFRAMQHALAKAREPASSADTNRMASPMASSREHAAKRVEPVTLASFSTLPARMASQPSPPDSATAGTASLWPWWAIAGLVLVGGGLRGWRLLRRRIGVRREMASGSAIPLSAAVRTIDEMVWRAFEQQGYQLLQTTDVVHPPGVARVVTKDGHKALLCCIGEGVFFEKTTVERCVQFMQQAQVDQGYLIVPGSFTVPAQRYAKEQGVVLIDREQLVDLLSAGAMRESYLKQLQQLQQQVEESKRAIAESTTQVELLRRQRNEASWFLGEERAKTGQLEAQIGQLQGQLQDEQAQTAQWQQTADQRRKEWEESQWYLGEARAQAAHLEQQLHALQRTLRELEARDQELRTSLQDTQRQRDDANWYLGELRMKVHALEAALGEAAQARETLQREYDAMQAALATERARRDKLVFERDALQRYGERRKAPRISRHDILIEVQDDTGATLFQGVPRDLSAVGFGWDGDKPFNGHDRVRIRIQQRDSDHSLESRGRLVWQREDPMSHRYVGGYTFLEFPPESREQFRHLLAHTHFS